MALCYVIKPLKVAVGRHLVSEPTRDWPISLCLLGTNV